VDVKHRCLIDAVTFCLYACTLSGADSIRLSSMLSAIDDFRSGAPHCHRLCPGSVPGRQGVLGAPRHCSPLQQPVGFTPPHCPEAWWWVAATRILTHSMTQQHRTATQSHIHVFMPTWLEIRGYHQVPVHPLHVPKTVGINQFGLFKFLHMPFGLMNIVQTFQCLIDSVLRDLPFLFVYLDYILVNSTTKSEHLAHLQTLFERLNQHALIVNPAKCQFGLTTIEFLGHCITRDGLVPLPLKVDAIITFLVYLGQWLTCCTARYSCDKE